MQKANKTVIKETQYIAFWVILFSVLMQVIFLLTGKWNYTVLMGNLWGASLMILNFFFMGISVQKAVEKDENDAKNVMKVSHSVRTFALFLGAILGVLLPWMSTVAVIIPFIFPRIAILIRPLCDKKSKEA